MKVRLYFHPTDAERHAIRVKQGRSGFATREEVESWIGRLVNEALEKLPTYDEEESK